MLELKRGLLTAEAFNTLTEAVGWGHPSLEQVELALKNSLYTACVVDGETVVAMCRLFGDGSMSYFIKDVVVTPSYQGKGIGKLLINDMLAFIKERTPRGWRVCIELMSAHGKEGFYEGFGFEKRPNDSTGPGMSFIMNNL